MTEEEMEKEENLEHEVLDRLWLMTENDFNKDILDDSYIDAMLKARNIILKLYKRQEEVIDLMAEDIYENDNFYKLKCAFEKVEKGKEKEYIKERFYKGVSKDE